MARRANSVGAQQHTTSALLHRHPSLAPALLLRGVGPRAMATPWNLAPWAFCLLRGAGIGESTDYRGDRLCVLVFEGP